MDKEVKEFDMRSLRRPFAAAAFAYVLLIFVGVFVIYRLEGADRSESAPAWVGVVLALAAALPAVTMIVVGPLMLRRQEGMEREVLMRSASIAFFSTMVAALTYGLFEAFAGAPNLSSWWTYVLGMCAWMGASVVINRRMT